MGTSASRLDPDDDRYRAADDQADGHAHNQPAEAPLNRSGLLGSETLMLAPTALSFAPRLGNPPFPRLTASQMASLRDSGVDLDLCFQPYQMPRLEKTSWTVLDESSNVPKQKRFAYVNSTMSVRKETISISIDRHLSFVVDVSVPCRVRVWVGATQVNEAGAADPLFECHEKTSYRTISLDPGNGQRIEVDLNQLTDSGAFSSPLNPAAALSPDMSSADDNTLNLFQQSRQFWPLIIHLQDITPDKPTLVSRGNDVSDVTPTSIDHFLLYCVFTAITHLPRSSQPPSDLVNSPDIGVQVVKRIVRCGTYRFELGEVYGLRDESSAAPESNECVICLTNRRTHAIYPCRHMCLCEDCATELARQSTRCPICRKAVQTVIPVMQNADVHPVDVEA